MFPFTRRRNEGAEWDDNGGFSDTTEVDDKLVYGTLRQHSNEMTFSFPAASDLIVGDTIFAVQPRFGITQDSAQYRVTEIRAAPGSVYAEAVVERSAKAISPGNNS